VSGPKVLITGAGRGIGRALARRFAREGAQVVVAARTEAEIEAVAGEVEELGGSGLAVPMDVTDLASVEEGVHRALGFTGGVLDVLVNNAGILRDKSFANTTEDPWDPVIAVHLRGT